jgi:hypothetical protein
LHYKIHFPNKNKIRHNFDVALLWKGPVPQGDSEEFLKIGRNYLKREIKKKKAKKRTFDKVLFTILDWRMITWACLARAIKFSLPLFTFLKNN